MVDAKLVSETLRGCGVDAELVVVFGSHARGTERAGSDLDLGVLVAGDEDPDWAMLEVALERALAIEVDLVDLRRAPPLLRFEIARDGAPVLERLDGAWTDFRARAMVDWWDWKPYAELFQRALLQPAKEPEGSA